MILSYCPVRTVHHMQRGQNMFFVADMLIPPNGMGFLLLGVRT
jgi:hypothetical protein